MLSISYKIKAVFSEEIYVPQPQIESASMLTALYCVTKIQAEIHNQKSMHKHNFALPLK